MADEETRQVGLALLPTELVERIALATGSPQSVCALATTCRRMAAVLSSSLTVWRTLYRWR
jgi:hypothetical protein